MLHSPLFPQLQHRWKKDSAVAALNNEVESLIAERNRGVNVCPSSESLQRSAKTLRLFRQLYDNIPQPDSGGTFQFYRAYAAAILRLQPLVDAARWPRWLMLERMLSSASAAGDLLAAALALRTQIEILDDFLQLQAYEGQLPAPDMLESPFPVTPADCQRVRDHATLLWARFLPLLGVPKPDEMTRRPALPARIAPKPVELDDAFAALNDYVHPNYGSHVQAIRPEQATAGVVLLRAFVSVYRSFLAFPWARRPAASPCTIEAPKAETSWDQMVEFVKDTLPCLCQKLRNEHGYPNDWRLDSGFLGVFRERLDHARQQWEEFWRMISDHCDERELDTLRPILGGSDQLCSALPAKELFFFPQRTGGFGLPATAAEWLALAGIRRYALKFEQAVETLGEESAFPASPPYDSWVRFLKTAVEFSVMVGLHKMHLMQVAAKRSINERNPLAAILCARSLMEHYAVSVWLSEKFKEAWDKIEDAARSNRDVRPMLSELEADVGRFLAGTKGTAEATTPWRSRWLAAGRARHVNLETAIDKAFPAGGAADSAKPTLRFLYDWFCRVIHGDRMTGSDLLEPGSSRIAEKQFAKVVMVLAAFEGPEILFRLYGLVASAVGRMARPSGLQSAETPEALRTAIKEGTIRNLQFKRGRDVFGAGTESDPYYFRQELFYHEAFYAFLDHEEIRSFSRSVWLFRHLPGDRVETKDGRVLFFWNRYPQFDVGSDA